MDGGTVEGAVPTRRRPARFSATKFLPPTLPASFVARPALRAELDHADDQALFTVVGSPGAGKTTVLADWVSHRPAGTTAWLSADAADRDPARFWQGALTAVASVVPGFGEEAFDLVTLDGSVQPDALESILAACEALDAPTTLIVDDLHLASPEVHDHVRFLVSRGLGHLHLVLGTRAELLGLARLRMEGEVRELRDADLRFQDDELDRFLTAMGLEVGPDDRAVLQDRTEGWVAGVHLAAVALRDQDGAAGFVQRLAGTSQAISQYLSFEVLDAQTPAVQRFLLDTCVVDELTPGLASELSPESGVTVDQVEAAGLLLTRLDPNGDAYRYHHLLTEMLRSRLHVSDPDRERLLHARAADHHAAHGDLRAAFHHRWRAGDAIGALALTSGLTIDQHLAGDALGASQIQVTLSDADIVSAPGPAVGFCSSLSSAGAAEGAHALATRVHRLAADQLTPEEHHHLLAARVAAFAGLGRNAEIVELAQPGRAHRSPTAPVDGWLDFTDAMLLRALTWEDHVEAADELARTSSRTTPSLEMRSAIALAHLEHGYLHDVDRITGREAAVALAGRRLDRTLVPLATVVGCTRLEQGDLVEAERVLGDLVARDDAQFRVGMNVLARLGLGRLLWAEGRFDAAQAVLAGAYQAAQQPASSSAMTQRIACLEARFLIDGRSFDEAAALLEGLPRTVRTELERAHLARATGRVDAAAATLDGLDSLAATPRQQLELAVARLTHACLVGAPTEELAATVLDQAEALGATFVVAEGGSGPLAAVVAVGRRRPRTPFLDQLAATRPHALPAARASAAFALDALSERERTVLRYLVTSLSYREMADELYVSVNTVKTHVKNIIRKLHATSRADAIERARELHYL